MLSALSRTCSCALNPPHDRQATRARPPLEHGAGAAFDRTEFTTSLGRMLETRRNVEHAGEITPATRAKLDELRSHGILERDGTIYRASHVALYSTFAYLQPPIH